MSLKKNTMLLAKSTVNALKNKASILNYYYAKKYDQTEINENLILYENRDGQSITDSPLALFLQICKDPKYENFEHIWVIQGNEAQLKLLIPEEFISRVKFIKRNTKEYINYLLTSKYLVNNSTFQSFFVKKKDQIYINTWHGTPLKYMGFDIPGNPKHSQNVLRNLLMVDYFLSPNSYTTKIFSESYKLQDIYPGTIIEAGYPRIDMTFQNNNRKVLEKVLKETKIELNDEKKIILYTPTWKGTSIQNPTINISQIITEIKYLQEKLNDEYQLLIKVHPYVYPFIKNNPSIQDVLVPDFCDANQLLGSVDILITDYSSIFFDFLVTDKPIIFYVWDKDIYSFERGMYLEESEFPGPVAENVDELIDVIDKIDLFNKEYQEKYRKAKEKFVQYDDGNVSERIVNYIFLKQNIQSNHGRTLKIASDKKRIVIYPGNLLNNGITTSFLNLMNNIDYDIYDVTVFVEPTGDEGMINLLKINSNVRFLFKPGIPIYTIKEDFMNRKIQAEGLSENERDRYPRAAFRRESNRLLANLSFDVSIDFSGYSFFWAKLLLGANAKKYIIFQHNDLMSDSKKVINGVMPHRESLRALFSIYFNFDRILSVSPSTMKINEENLSKYVQASQIGYAINTINIESILQSNNKINEIKQDSKINRVNLLFQVKDAENHVYFKNIQSINCNERSKYYLSKEDKILAVANIEVDNQLYYKCLINNRYIGWFESSILIEMENEVFDIEKVNLVATVFNMKDKFIWKKLETVFQKECVSQLDYLVNTYVFIDKKADTLKGEFYHINLNKTDIGWVESSTLARFHKLSFFSPLKYYFEKQNRKKNIGITERYISLNNEISLATDFNEVGKIWKNPPGTTMSEEKSKKLDLTRNYFCDAEVTINGKYFDRIINANNEAIGWIEKKNLSKPHSQISYLKISHDKNSIDSNYFNFVTMGRLSPEKNHLNLIRAFHLLTLKKSNIRLYILGEGVLEGELRDKIEELELENLVFMLGYIPEPYRFIEQNNVFVLPSIYEGQPMVLLEAMTLQMKILATNIPANKNVLGEDEKYGMLINGTDVQSIYKGLLKIINFEGTFEQFDCVKYNKEAVQNFYEEIEVE